MAAEFYSCDKIWHNLRIASFDPAVGTGYGLLDNHLLGVQDGRILIIAPEKPFEADRFKGELIDGHGALLTPGLIDSHTHLVYGGQRAAEFAQRLQGASYAELARQGGGILSTVRATRALSEDQLLEQSLPRLLALAAEGVTCVEIKSGYGLTLADELKMLRVARRLEQEAPVRIRTTLLAAHCVPPEYTERADEYIELICRELIPRVAAEELADAVDVFCESIAFDLTQTRRVFEAAREHDLMIKVHAEQLSTTGAAALAAEFGACSADHLEYLDEAGIAALRQAGTVATLLPGAFYALGETRRPPIEQLRRAGVPIALASDLNPGSSPFASLLLMLNLGCNLFGLAPAEALAGVTRQAAQALGLAGQLGALAEGYRADLLLWQIEHPAQLCSEFGWHRPVQRIFAGEVQNVSVR